MYEPTATCGRRLTAAYNLRSATVTTQAELTTVVDDMIGTGPGPRLIELRTPADQITPAATIADIRRAARA